MDADEETDPAEVVKPAVVDYRAARQAEPPDDFDRRLRIAIVPQFLWIGCAWIFGVSAAMHVSLFMCAAAGIGVVVMPIAFILGFACVHDVRVNNRWDRNGRFAYLVGVATLLSLFPVVIGLIFLIR